MSKRFILPLILVVSVLVTGACRTITQGIPMARGSGDVVSETREVSGYDRLVFMGFGDVTITQGDEEGLEVEAEDNIIGRITTEVRNGTLYIEYNDEEGNILPTRPINFDLRVRELSAVENSGAGSIHADSLDTGDFNVAISGAGNINLANLQANSVNVALSGAGNIDLSGQAERQEVNVSGAGSYQGGDLQTQSANVTISGFGNVTVWVEEELDVTISGAGGVDYYGSPQVTENIEGVGGMDHLGDK